MIRFLTIILFLSLAKPVIAMQMYILTLRETTYTIDVEGYDTISDVKQKIYDREGVPPEKFKLAIAGKELDDNRTLSDYNIQPRSTLQMVLIQPPTLGLRLTSVDLLAGAACLEVYASEAVTGRLEMCGDLVSGNWTTVVGVVVADFNWSTVNATFDPQQNLERAFFRFTVP